MAGKFVNTEINDTIQSVTTGVIDRINNNYYHFNSLTPITVTYYNLDPNKSGFDESLGTTYDVFGEDSSLRYNKIKEFIIYGVDKIDRNISMTDFGAEADEVTGKAIIIPNTVIPHPNDFFEINYLKEPLLFKVINAQATVLDTGSNCYEIEYTISHSDNTLIDENVTDEFNYIVANAGTSYNPVILSSNYDLLDYVDTAVCKLRLFYKSIFYSDRVDALILNNNGLRFYDSFLTEFVIDTGILSDKSNFLYLTHQVPVSNSFSIQYNRSFFRYLIDKDRDNVQDANTYCFGEMIENRSIIFYNRVEEYFKMIYKPVKGLLPGFNENLTFYTFDSVLMSGIKSGELIEDDILSNIIIKYFNDVDYTKEDIEALDSIDFINNPPKLFYYVPVAIYCLEAFIKRLMSRKDN